MTHDHVTTVTSAKPFGLGNTVALKRNMDHPAWQGGSQDLDEDLGQTTVTESRITRGHPVAGIEALHRVRCDNGFWYVIGEDEGVGTQEHSSATRIEAVPDRVLALEEPNT